MDNDWFDDLLQPALRGDDRAQGQLLDRLFVTIVDMAKRHSRIDQVAAEEIASEAIMVIWAKYRTATFHKGFRAWVYKIMDNLRKNHLAKRDREIDNKAHYSQNAPVRSRYDIRLDFLVALRDCIKMVSASNRRYAPILSWMAEGKTKAMICRWLKLTSRTFDANLLRARVALRACLEEKGAF